MVRQSTYHAICVVVAIIGVHVRAALVGGLAEEAGKTAAAVATNQEVVFININVEMLVQHLPGALGPVRMALQFTQRVLLNIAAYSSI